jgi:hypothetical protein
MQGALIDCMQDMQDTTGHWPASKRAPASL